MMAFLHNLKSVFHVLIIFQCVVFSIFLLSARPKKRGHTFLILFLVAVGLNELGGVFLHFLDLRRLIVSQLPRILYLDYPLSLLAAPLLYLFVLSVVRKDLRLKLGASLHLLPFAACAVLIIVRYQVLSPEGMRQVVAAGGPFSRTESLAYNLVFFGQWLGYGWACFQLLHKHRDALKDCYSTVKPWDLGWLNFLLTAVLLTRCLEAVEYGLWAATGDTRVVVLYYAAQVLFLIFLTMLFLRALHVSQTLQGVIETLAARPKYEKTLLSETQKSEYARKLERFMEAERPFLDPLLSLADLAKKVLIPPHYLSQVLNAHFGMNFFDFINSYRIRESRKLLADPGNGRRTILDVLLESGFNSKSVFNTAFKKHAGMTPSQYKKSVRAADERVA